MGLGHIYRACALAEALGSRYACCFLLRKSNTQDVRPIVQPYFQECIELTSDDALEAAEVAGRVQPSDIVILDGYHFDTAYQQAVKQSGCRLVCVDDIFAFPFEADVIINHAGGISPQHYAGLSKGKLYLGPRYAMIRTAFVRAAATHIAPQPGRVMVSFGGADPQNCTRRVVEDQLRNPNPQRDLHVVVGASYRFLEALEQLAQTHEGLHLHHNIGGEAMATLMASSSLCIGTPSTVAFEYLTASRGQFVMYQIADNQATFQRYLREKGLATDYHDFLKTGIPSDTPEATSERSIYDGKSHERLLEIFDTLSKRDQAFA